MNGGSISSNTVTTASGDETGGAGVYVERSGSFTKASGAEIYGSDGGGNANKVQNAGSDVSGKGHVAYVHNTTPSLIKYRDINALAGVTLESSYAGVLPGGNWN